jgi:Sulfotransferase family
VRAAQLTHGSAEAYDGLAFVSTELHQHERANALYRRAVELEPSRPRYWYNLACSERGFGRLAQAEDACDRSIALDARQYPSLLLRSELRVQTSDANHIEDLERRLADRGLDIDGQIFLGYALAKELDDVQRFEEAFHWFERAAKARRSQLRYDVAADERTLQHIADVFSEGLGPLAIDPRAHASSPYVFIVGLPRSGTTLVERILTGLEDVRSNGETDNVARALTAAAAAGNSASPLGHSDMVERAAAADPALVAVEYGKLAGIDVQGQRIVEKLPTNYLYLGAICRALPGAKVVWVRRSPLDSCFAMYRALFGNAYPFSYDAQELARYYAAYEKLMAHWMLLCEGAILPVYYEELVRDPQRVGAVIAKYCDLPWRAEAAEIDKNKAVSLTASAVQVRRAIYDTSVGRWRHYRRHLSPLIAALRRQGVALPDDA